MTLSELKNRCDMAGIAYSYGSFEQSIQPPHLVGHVIDSDNFSADDMVYYTNSNFQLELTTLKKDLQLNKKIESEILFDVYWEKNEEEIKDERIFNTSYFFDIKEE